TVVTVILAQCLTIFLIVARVRTFVWCVSILPGVGAILNIVARHFHRFARLRLTGRGAAFQTIFSSSCKLGRQFTAALHLPEQLTGLRKLLVELRSSHVQRRKILNLSFGNGVANLLGVELLIDVVVQAELPDALDIARPRAESKTIQNVQDALIFVEILGFRGLLLSSPTRHEYAND